MSKSSIEATVVTPLADSSSYIDQSGQLVTFRLNGSCRVSLSFVGDPGCTEQAHKDSCDISYILSSHVRLGGIPPMPESEFNDLTQIPDYQTCLNSVMRIDSLFESLPLDVRVAYDHNPALFMQAVADPSQKDKLVSLGVFEPMEGLVAGDLAPASNVETV